MADRSRIPPKMMDFDAYINRTDKWLQALDPATSVPNWQRLELKPAEAGWWHDQCVYWKDTLYKKHSNKTTQTIVTTAEVKQFRANFKKQSAHILDKIAVADAANNADELEFNLKLKKNRKKPGYHQVSMDERVALLIKTISNGRVHITCRYSTDRNRASLPPMANSVEIAYVIGSMVTDPDAMTHRKISTRASFYLELGGANIGKFVYVYARWYHTKHPHLAGPWSEMTRHMIG